MNAKKKKKPKIAPRISRLLRDGLIYLQHTMSESMISLFIEKEKKTKIALGLTCDFFNLAQTHIRKYLFQTKYRILLNGITSSECTRKHTAFVG